MISDTIRGEIDKFIKGGSIGEFTMPGDPYHYSLVMGSAKVFVFRFPEITDVFHMPLVLEKYKKHGWDKLAGVMESIRRNKWYNYLDIYKNIPTFATYDTIKSSTHNRAGRVV